MSAIEKRLEELEIRAAHQDQAIADLNEVITAQWKSIAALERQVRRLDQELQSINQGDSPPVQKPPHY